MSDPITPPTAPPLPYARQQIDAADIAAVVAVLASDWLTSGPILTQFERAFAAQCGAAEAIACANGTAALHLALLAAGIGEGDRVVVPTLTFAASANAVRLTGAEVVLADVDAATGLLTADTLAAALSEAPDARAVVAVHLNGQCADLAALATVAGDRPLLIDAAHALGGHYRPPNGAPEAVGSGQRAQLTTFSLHPTKILTAAEGGVVTTDDTALAERLRLLRGHGISRDPATFTEPTLAYASDGSANPWYYELQQLGLNYRLSELHCALALSQLSKLTDWVALRRQRVADYDAAIAALPLPLSDWLRPPARNHCSDPAWHLYPIRINFAAIAIDRAALMNQLAAAGIGTQVHYLPLHQHPYYRHRYGEQSLPGAEHYYQQALSLPLHAAVTAADCERVITAITAIMR